MRSIAPLLLLVLVISCTGTIDTTLVGNVCGDAIINGQEICDTGSESQTCDSDCTTPVCGDGRVNKSFTPASATGPEECDDGGNSNGDGCSSTCQLEASENLEPRCGDGVVGADELCDTGIDSATCDSDCTAPACGDGHVNKTFTPAGAATFEHCDDGGTVDGDGCSAACQFEWCGNGIADGEEACDDGNDVDLDACRNDCTRHACGDGIDSLAEACDAGGDGPACDADCTIAECGDARVNRNHTPLGAPGVEQCDDGGTDDGDGCSATCQIETCGNNVTETANGEECDDGNETDTDACRNDCRLPRCGDGLTNGTPIEDCDSGAINSVVCNFDCTTPACGDGIINRLFTPPLAAGVEQCDDGGTAAGDGCSATCQIETCGNNVTEAVNGEQCDDGNAVDDDTCRNNCQLPTCGDGVVNNGEPCDSAGQNTASCNFNCTSPACGDGVLNRSFTPPLAPGFEQCDDGGTNNGNGCSSLCQIETCGNGTPESSNGEQCDDGNSVETDSCRNNCQNPRCGDGVLRISPVPLAEFCDELGVNTSGCDYDCSQPQCNDGLINVAAGEECDDANFLDDRCTNTCRINLCGDGVLWSGVEACDDGGDLTSCDYDCTDVQCNDGIVNTAAGEDCDDGNNDGSDGCSACRFTFIDVPTIVDFGTVTVGNTGGPLPVPVFNPSAGDFIEPIDVVFASGGSVFSVASSDCTLGLAPLSSCTIFIQFDPDVDGPHADQALIGSDSFGGRRMVFLSGEGVP